MTASIYSYRKASDQYTTITARVPDSPDDGPRCTELCTLSGVTYLAVPAEVTLPAQPPEITLAPVTLTDDLRSQIVEASPRCKLIDQLVQKRIRSKYSVADEQYYTRIAVGALMQIYTFEPGERDELTAYSAWVEAARQFGRDQRAELGL